MELISVLKIAELIIAVALIFSVLFQQKEGGLGNMFGSVSGGEAYRTKRGLELLLSRMTIVLTILLIVNTLAIAKINSGS